MRFLLDPSKKTLAEFINSPLWAEVKLCLDDRRGEAPNVQDPSHVAAAKGHQRTGAERMIRAIEELPFERDDVSTDPFQRPALDPED